MQTITLNTGGKIPVIGFGTWRIWPSARAEKAVMQALNVGYRHIDTARIYGNERGVGRGIAKSGVNRKEIFVTTKLWNLDQGYDSSLRAFDASLKRLGLDYVDLYLIHWPATNKRHESWRALEEIHKSGRARAIGVSNYTVRHLQELLGSSKIVPAVNQVEFHPFLYKQQAPLLEYCMQHKIIVEAHSPLAHAERINDPVITGIAEKIGKTNAQVMLRWAMQYGTVLLPKSTHVERMRENIDIFDFALDKAAMQRLDELSDGDHTTWDPSNVT